ncbi:MULTISPECIES: excalibur calcium-binding domain-containing protein [unclassified Acinetobacter]|uniref:excalibur calcium-binding domain-containing protein n=1 Tax=unclassified Acinetobacter TaxID=196816 RepID=UPI00190CE689|nr:MULTISPECIES: excalibur calcium-binding domain-containing protein [unclassified Acinetobacter]MBK0062602.1 excalibur calcium-binding domain-containing protein [Acinetobacter sp. S55]MBK0065821.1 excalibur calcium-binding domain-containing protein [Acinetobacter sp. S54]
MKNLILALLIGLCLPSIAFAKYCKDFKTHAEAQAYFNAKKPGYKRLDRDGDGSACDCLPGGTGKKCPKNKK